MDADATTPFGAWASIRGYFTPATLFLVLNLVIGTIALTSRSHQRRRRELHHDYDHHQGHYQVPPLDPQQEYHDYYYQQQQQQPQDQYATPPPPPAPLGRTSSVMDRLRSIGLYRFRSGDFPPEYGTTAPNNHDAFAPVEEEAAAQYATSRSEPAPAREERRRAPPPRTTKKSGTEVVRKTQAARAPAARVVEAVAADHDEIVDARAEEFIGSLRQQEPSSPPQKAEYLPYQEEYVPPPAPIHVPPPLSRTSSVLDRLRSLGLYSFLAAEQPATTATLPATEGVATATPPGDKKQAPAHAQYDRSRSEPAREQGKKEKKQAAEARMAKSSSTTRKAAAAPSLVAEEDCVDARAEAFIDSFRKERSQKQVHHDEDEHVVPPPPAPLARTSSVLDRLRSFSLYLRSSDPVPEDPVFKASAADEKKQAQYDRSRSEPAREHGKKNKKKQGTESRLSKTSSEANIAEEAAPAEECVDARADDFINKFRQQLQLQRLNSLLNGKEVLNRGGSKQQ